MEQVGLRIGLAPQPQEARKSLVVAANADGSEDQPVAMCRHLPYGRGGYLPHLAIQSVVMERGA